MPGGNRFALIANPNAGKRQFSRTHHLVMFLESRGLDIVWVQTVATDPERAAEAAIKHGATALIASGGDGTVSSVAAVAVKADVPLGVLPLGTLNHFARDLKLPLDIEQAVNVLVAGHSTRVDVGEVNGSIFLNNSGLGFYPRLAISREHGRRHGRNRWLALASAIFRTMRNLPMLDVRIMTDREVLERVTPVILVANNEYCVQGVAAGTRERLDAGRLYVYLANARSSMDLVRLSLRALASRIESQPEFESFNASQIRVETRRSHTSVSHDGQVTRMATPLVYQIKAQALRVFVPEPAR